MKRRGIDFKRNAARLIDGEVVKLIDAMWQDLIGTARQDLIDATRHATSLLKPRTP